MFRAARLSDLGEEDRARFGAKAVNLGLLTRAGFPVPPGIALACEDGEIDPEAIRRAYAELGRGAPPVAVRSSAVGEDGEEFSFAGLHTSLLDVVGADAVVEAVAACLASQDGERVAAYREQADRAAAGRAVVIQRMVPAEHAGICFTRSPAAQDEVVVELVSGLAEGLAAGTRTPARLRFAREGLALRGSEGPQELADAFGEDAAREVARLSLAAEARFERPLDVEWAACGGKIALVQARPITAGARLALAEEIRREEIARLAALAKDAGRLVVWTDFSLADVFPRPTPLDVEFLHAIGGPGGGLTRAFERLGLRPMRDPRGDPYFEVICGRAYFDLDGLAKGVDRDLPVVIDARRLPEGSDLALDPALAPLRAVWPGWRGVLRLPALLFRLARAARRVGALSREYADHFETTLRPAVVAEAAELRRQDLAALSDRALASALRGRMERLRDLVYYHQLTDNLSFVLHRRLRVQLRLLYGEKAESMETGLTTALPGNFNTETNLDLARVARGELERGVFLERYGQRGNPDTLISSPRWREDPSRVDVMLDAIARAPREPLEQFAAQERMRTEAEADFAARLRRHRWLRFFRRSVLRGLRDYQRYSPQRETSKALFHLFVELVRTAVLEAARRSDLGELVFHFTLPELEAWLETGASPELRARARERRRRLRVARSLYVPHVVRSDRLEVIGRPPPIPDDAKLLEGQKVASGTARGRARVVQCLEEAQGLEPGEILVAAAADPAWTPLFLVAGGVVLEQGGLLSHPAIVAREYGLPAVVNVPHATRRLRTGQELTVDADRGLVIVEAS